MVNPRSRRSRNDDDADSVSSEVNMTDASLQELGRILAETIANQASQQNTLLQSLLNNTAGTSAAAAPAPAASTSTATTSKPDQLLTNPFEGDINPGSAAGSKLYLKATESLSEKERFECETKNAHKILQAFNRDASKFCWNKLIGQVPDGKGGTGTVNI